ncbi:YdaU family protein [Bartonella sp. A05]|uniref:YdaU family protein n=1 Tax=Bartonella sp. A05 TaxID=2967261 RepID=UPI0022A9B438|nr:DUF1376 domain-containing protein [Bartonella sp. A05]MCZ2203698.1 YdaU family protein [Bartonella sp. A05]
MKQEPQAETPNYESSTLPYVCWYQNDFLGGVRGMRAHEIGIYTILLNEMYARGRPLDLSVERLARLCGCDKRTFVHVLEMLIAEGKILNLASGLWNERCENVFYERAKLLEQKSYAGRSSAKKRKEINIKVQHLLNAHTGDAERNSEAQKGEEKETPNGVSQKHDLSLDGVSEKLSSRQAAPIATTSLKKRGSPEGGSKGQRLPSDWIADIDAAIAEGLSEEQARWQEKKFRDYWQAKSGKEALKVDWQATWRNWFRREIERLRDTREKLSVFSASRHGVSCSPGEEILYRSLINYQANDHEHNF